ncbi:hypothetical protein HPB48_006768 [Haemaphysalis longicornis]|uniref:TRAF-type domain-containing protein n=1 Tax=Haemaphysalis longicornis TaxID=44386 RepID=A0A9J6FP22_HAELO|nr:hypothetical protein HPB48_006768 [Haemaphysalis longicornis]
MHFLEVVLVCAFLAVPTWKSVLAEKTTTPKTFFSRSNCSPRPEASSVGERATCPFTMAVDVDPTRIPSELPVVKCNCPDNLCSSMGDYRCTETIDNCWNSQHGCTFTGDSTSLARHLEQECRFHEITCAVCHVRVLQMDISKHLWQDCSKSAEAAGGAAAVSVSAGSSSRPLSAATVSPGDSPLTVGDVDRAFKQLKEMFSSLTAHQIAIVETRVNELSENIASLEAKLVDVDASEQSDTTEEEELLDSVMPKLEI